MILKCNIIIYYRGEIMSEKFIVTSKTSKYKEDPYNITTLRMPKEIRQEFDKLAGKSDYSRNQLMCMALQYALDNLQFISESKDNEQ